MKQGYNDKSVFFSVVWEFSAFPWDSWDVTMKRLKSAIKDDCERMGEKYELTPQRVVRAYRNHYSLRIRERVVRKWRADFDSRRVDLEVDHPLVIGEPSIPTSFPSDAQMGFDAMIRARDLVDRGDIKDDEGNRSRFKAMVGWLNKLEQEGISKKYIDYNQNYAVAVYRSARKYLGAR